MSIPRPRPLALACVLALGARAAPAATRAAEGADDRAVHKVVKTLITAIRYKKDDLAAKQLALPQMAQALMAAAWSELTPEQQKAFVVDLEALIRRISFVRGREMFEYLDAVTYEPIALSGDEAHCKSTVVVHRDLKKTEMQLEWRLTRGAGRPWQVLDLITLGDSTLAGLRTDQVEPLLKEGGAAAVLKALHDKAKSVAEAGGPS